MTGFCNRAGFGVLLLFVPAFASGAAPAIAMLQNNYSYIVPGLPNYGIAPGSLFLITGTDLADPNTPVLQSSAAPGIPTSLNGASISVTVNDVTVHPGMYYATPTAIAAVLPSSTPVGQGTITVTYKGAASAPAQIQVISTALGLDTYYGYGTGLGVATDPASGTVFTYNNSAGPGQTIVLWGTGLGAGTDSDTVFTPAPHAVDVPLQIFIGGIQAVILYRGASGFPGVNQINVVIPPLVQTGCGVSVVAVSGSIVSNMVSIPVNSGGGVCVDPLLDASRPVTTTLETYKTGVVSIGRSNSAGQASSTANGSFFKISGATYSDNRATISVGSCYASQSVAGPLTVGGITSTGLDAGALTITGPSGSRALDESRNSPGSYIDQLPDGFVPPSGGSFFFTGYGGKDVGPFTVSLNFPNPLVWTNSNSIATVTRSNGLTVTWSGGAPQTYVIVSGVSTSPTGAKGSVTAGFACYAPVDAGQLTVPANVLLALPAGTGSLALQNFTKPVPFATSGLDYAYAQGTVSASTQPSYQ